MALKQIERTTNKRAYWKYVLAANNLTQRQLAKKLGCSYEWVNRVIGGHDNGPDVISELEALEAALVAAEAIHVN